MVLNNVLAVNPFIRYWTSMMYLSNVTGLSRIYYPESSFLKAIRFDSLARPDKPIVYHNAWNLSKQTLDQFSNRIGDGYKQIDAQSLCACSALPFVEGTVDIDGDTYCEGALIDTVNFKQLLDDHPDLDEIWISRIVDAAQVRAPKNITEALGNLCMLFAATVGEDDIKLFKYHVKEDNKWKGRIVEIKVDSNINFDWTHSNLENGRDAGYRATDAGAEGLCGLTEAIEKRFGALKICGVVAFRKAMIDRRQNCACRLEISQISFHVCKVGHHPQFE